MRLSGFGAGHRALLPEGRVAGPMPWVMAIMMLLTLLSAAAALGLTSAAARLEGASRLTVQIVEADPVRREAEANAALAALHAQPALSAVERVDQNELARLLEPWLGAGGVEADLPIPALIEAELAAGDRSALPAIRAALARAAPAARLDDSGAWLGSLRKLVKALRWVAVGLVLLMAGAAAATVVLAARAALDTHRATIEVLHLIGATDSQVARLFQRRLALDALFGAILGALGGAAILWMIGERVRALGSELIGSVQLPPSSWVLLGAVPLAGVALAMLVARLTILRALSRLL